MGRKVFKQKSLISSEKHKERIVFQSEFKKFHIWNMGDTHRRQQDESRTQKRKNWTRPKEQAQTILYPWAEKAELINLKTENMAKFIQRTKPKGVFTEKPLK
jgi:hypothetical protein